VRHEVAPITVKSAFADLHPLFHQRFPIFVYKRDQLVESSLIAIALGD
jgi:hypothetical protein